ncbi:MAG: Uncharacterized protein FD165_504 [Gammaproteobacteria bacterium]|nr:MAG: Uncharacterized protein FD165_504 [Gammaproteobacteria bacterium]TND02234.1 MAG: Uncharacterized protein FD120_2398 [Gammaproteobacteria bacterium]
MDLGTLRREIDWRLQNTLTASLPVIKRNVTTVERMIRELAPGQLNRFRQLAAQYPVDTWASHCTPKEFLFNLYVLDVLDRHLPTDKPVGRGLDIGASSWSYLPALATATNRQWDGVEIDAHRRYWTLATRRAHAEFMCHRYPGCRYFPRSLLGVDGSYACITWFLPFVMPAALHAWRLPRRFYQPDLLLQHAWSRLLPDGLMFVVNQGDRETAEQRRLFTNHGIPANFVGELTSVFSGFSQPRYAWTATKVVLTPE